jgi:regulator of sirC expression with transglutaminase-like and TPR domain
LFIDAFGGGRIMQEGDLPAFLSEVAGPGVLLEPAFLRPVTPPQFLHRMLNNLKAIYRRREDHRSALASQEFILVLSPDDPAEVRDRGLLFHRLGRVAAAERDLRRYLTLAPHADDRPSVAALVQELQGWGAMYR